MKKIITTIILLSLVALFGTANAADGAVNKKQSLDKLIERSVSFPLELKSQSTNEMVLVSFRISDNCMIEVQDVNTSNPAFSKHVMEQLAKLDLSKVPHEYGKTYCYKFMFRSEN